MAFPYLEAVIGFKILMYFFETYLEVRQLRANKLTTLPKTLEGVISEDTFQKTRSYSLDHSRFHFVCQFVTIVRDSAILFFGVMPWFWKKSEDFMTLIGLNADNEILHSIAFLAGCMILLQITKLPLSLYFLFVLEAHHDCNKSTPAYTAGVFFVNMIKGIIVAALVGPPIVTAIIYLVPKGGPYLAIYVWALGNVFIIYEQLIAPLFKKITPVSIFVLLIILKLICLKVNSEKIEELAASLKFPARKLFVVDGSKWSNKHSNVQMTGLLHNTGILLNDKIVQQDKNDEEVLAVIAHELGHWKLNHFVPLYVAMQFVPLLNGGGFTLARNSTDLFQSFGFHSQPVIIGLIIYLLIAAPLNYIVMFGRNHLFRSIEFQADAFAVKLGYKSALRSVLVKKQMENLMEFNADPWYYAYRVIQPPAVLRLTAMDELDKKAD
ncbi:CAAX prenyl protease-like protein [Medicago truncatula]|uniref:CAAX prenyl protease n=1 Tax=Medicago truncatula TaxID=3880 RepID=A0A072TMT9_MEDTR|nr:CAAX prenyl protease-like protein [Medicago truncatula]